MTVASANDNEVPSTSFENCAFGILPRWLTWRCRRHPPTNQPPVIAILSTAYAKRLATANRSETFDELKIIPSIAPHTATPIRRSRKMPTSISDYVLVCRSL
ncbi:unnamed protein product [Toxocara canis]|uniref:Uncharacterized protein n=1 Tax=Toxocara canis TaxID=6265 RepID=A0A183UGE4_TOXCA|nr:unnamed protein product [Toxocara canis]